MNELIVSMYDSGYRLTVALNGKIQILDQETLIEMSAVSCFDNDELAEFCKKHNIQRLIICKDGDIVIRHYNEVQ